MSKESCYAWEDARAEKIRTDPLRDEYHRGWLWGWLAGMATFAGIVAIYAWLGG